MLYLFLRFPLGVATFTVAVALISVSLSLVLAPAYMWTSDEVDWGFWTFDPYPAAWFLPIVGIPALIVSMHLMNAMAIGSDWFARVMLGRLGDPAAEVDAREPAPRASFGPASQGRKTKRRVIGFRILYMHLAVYIVVIEMLAIIDFATGGGWWFYWPLIGWGIGVAVHALATISVLGAAWEPRRANG